MNDFEMPRYKSNEKTIITPQTIERVPCTHIIDNGGKYDKAIQLFHKKLLKYSMKKNNSNEVGFLINTKTWEYIIIPGKVDGVSLQKSDDARKMLNMSPDLSLIFLHNHPNLSTFSFADLNSFAMNRSLYVATAISNDANIYWMKKGLNFNGPSVLFEYNKYVDDNKGMEHVFKHCRQLGFEYKFGRCKK